MTRPCGWQHFALKVKGGKFLKGEDNKNNKWLGASGHRLGSIKGEWPVTYHGTQQENAHSIVCNGFLSSKGKRG